MPWFFNNRDGEAQEAVAVAIHDTASGALIGWVDPDVAAALAAGDITPEQVRALAEQHPYQPEGTTRSWWRGLWRAE